MTATMLDHALELATRGFEVFPLAGKVPAIGGGRGCLDATTDRVTVEGWWTARPSANIGVRIPVGQLVLDIDPRHQGDDGLRLLEVVHGDLPPTRTAETGRGDGGLHFYFLAPDAPLTSAKLPAGIDLKTRGGYVVAPPSLHPDTGQPYRWLDVRDPVALPDWLADLVVRTTVATSYTSTGYRPPGRDPFSAFDDSIADDYSARATWAEVLGQPANRWTLVRGDGESDGSRWKHPTATASWSATIRHGCLFVYSTNTPFEVTATGDVHGYTKVRAYAVLEHGGDLRAAARHLRVGAR